MFKGICARIFFSYNVTGNQDEAGLCEHDEACRVRKEVQGTNEGARDKEYLGCGYSYELFIKQCSFNLIIGGFVLACNTKPDVYPVAHYKT